MEGEGEMILHPRPSAIVAALYTLRDLDADVTVIHGPSGCCFKHSRLLEEDGMHVLTSGMDENDLVFGAHASLVRVLRKAEELFNPDLMGVVGTCSSMIIGEDLHEAVLDSGVGCDVIEVKVHAGYRDNTKGVIMTLESAYKKGIIEGKEFERQKRVLKAATSLEKKVGAASKSYIPPSKGDLKMEVANRLLDVIEGGKRGVCVLNAKKETVFMFADVLVAINKVSEPKQVVNLANLDKNVGLKRIRRYSETVLNELAAEGIEVDHIIGGLDEYPLSGEKAAALIKDFYSDYDFAVLLGIPHAVSLNEKMEIFSITNGPRTVEPLKLLGHDHVVVELDLHPKTMGVSGIVPSEFGDTIMKLKEQRS